MTEKRKGILRSFPATYRIAIVMQFFERGSYYGMMSILSMIEFTANPID